MGIHRGRSSTQTNPTGSVVRHAVVPYPEIAARNALTATSVTDVNRCQRPSEGEAEIGHEAEKSKHDQRHKRANTSC